MEFSQPGIILTILRNPLRIGSTISTMRLNKAFFHVCATVISVILRTSVFRNRSLPGPTEARPSNATALFHSLTKIDTRKSH
jgi:hypothetical protein